MRLLSRQKFLAMPPGTVYAVGTPHAYGSWNVKTGNIGTNDWTHDTLDFGALDCSGSGDFHDKMEAMLGDQEKSCPVDFTQTARDGMFSEADRYCVLETHDVRRLVGRLMMALDGH
jgi:hypothetical protein